MKYAILLFVVFAWIPLAAAQTEKPSSSLEGRVGRLEGIIEQIDKRLTNIEQDQRDMLKRLDAMESSLRSDMDAMESSLRSDMDAMRSELSNEINTGFRWLVGIVITLFLGNVGLNWYWSRKDTSVEAPSSDPRSEGSPVRSPVVDQP